MKKLILLGWLFAALAFAQPALVTVNGPINNTDGSGFTGRMTISNPRLLCLGVAIPAASRNYTLTSGVAFPVMQLYALGACTPGYSYTVVYLGSERTTAFWSIPATPLTTTVAAVEVQAPLPPNMQINLNQLQPGTLALQVPTWSGSAWGLAIPSGGGGSVNSVNGQTGAVVLGNGFAGLTPAWSSGTLNIPLSSTASVTGGLVTNAEHVYWDAKQAAITLGTTAQYLRGDLSLAAFPTIPSNTSQISESGNLYFTNARVTTAMAGLYQSPISLGTTAQYLRGDLSLAAFPAVLTNPMTTAGDMLVGGAAGALTRLAVPGNGTWCPNWSTGVVTLITCPGAGGGISSIGLTAPAAFTVTGSPLIANGTLAISGAGTAAQYILGTGALATFPTTWAYGSITGAPTIPIASSTTPVMDGVGTIGALTTFAKADHIHPSDTTRQSTITGAPGAWPTTWAWASLSGVPSIANTVNGVTGAVVLGNGFVGLTPAWSAGTLNIPMASTASVTAGLLSNVDYAAFAAKQAAITTGTQDQLISGLLGLKSLVNCAGALAYSTTTHLFTCGTLPTVASTTSALKGDGAGNAVAVTGTGTYCVHVDGTSALCGGGATVATTSAVLKGDGAGNAIAATPGTDFQAALGFTAENAANKGTANGYAGLNASSDVPIANLPVTGAGTTVPTVDTTPTVGNCLNWSANGVHDSGSACGAGGGGDVYQANSNTFLNGTTQTFTASSTAPVRPSINIGSAITTDPSGPVAGDLWMNGTGMKYRGAATTYLIAAANLSNTWTALQNFTSAIKFNSGTTGAGYITPAAAYIGSTDGYFNRSTNANHGFGASSTPAVMEMYDALAPSGTGQKLGVQPIYFSTGGSLANTTASVNLAAAPGSTVGQMWEVSGTVIFTGTITCTAGTFAATVTWTDGRGTNSYSPVSIAYGSLSSAAASGTTLGGQYNFGFQFVQRSAVAPTFATSLPTCTALPYDWFVSARRLG